MKFLDRLINLHPVSWWAFGLAMAISAGISTNAYALLAIIAFCIAGILTARALEKRPQSTNLFFWLAGFVVVTRLLFRIVFNYSAAESDIVFTLPRVEIDLGLGGAVALFGSVSKHALLAALTDGLRLSAIILSVAFATALSNPKKILKSTPAALFEIASAISVAINLAPQLIQSLHRVRRARSLRGRSTGLSALTATIIPVLEDTLDKSLELAASMDSRGFGRRGNLSNIEVLVSRLLSLVSMIFLSFGIFILLISVIPVYFATSLFALGVISAAISIRITSSRSNRTRHLKPKRAVLDYLIYALAIALIGIGMSGGLA